MSHNLDIFDCFLNRIYSCYSNVLLSGDMTEEQLSIYYKAVLDVEFELKKLRYNYFKFLEDNE